MSTLGGATNISLDQRNDYSSNQVNSRNHVEKQVKFNNFTEVQNFQINPYQNISNSTAYFNNSNKTKVRNVEEVKK